MKVVLTVFYVGLATGAPQLFSTPRAVNQDEVVSSVLSQLQPAIAAAVAQALRGSGGSASSSSVSDNSGSSPASTATPAKYFYEYKVANDNTQTYISQQESRDGLEVEGTYSYVDPTGAIVTVRYTAGEQGYSETRERKAGAVNVRARPAAPTAGPGLDTAAIIARVVAALQPAIQTAVSRAVSQQ